MTSTFTPIWVNSAFEVGRRSDSRPCQSEQFDTNPYEETS